jgi:NAD(P)-dependent dehydrogenase (short-subunit alcohol dehydrogenase family)
MTEKALLDKNSVVLVSGGARGITAECVVRLAERAQCKFILLGRSQPEESLPVWAQNGASEAELKRRIMEDLAGRGEKPTPQRVQQTYRRISTTREIQQTLEKVRRTGGTAEYVSVDITDAQAVSQALPAVIERMGAVNGIIHGAGSLADKLIEKKTGDDFETVFSPKIAGLESLLTAVPASQLSFLVLFSSIVGFYGNIGQTDYAMANEILNKSAHLLKQKYPELRVISIDWGPWDAGMVTPELKRAFEARNMHVIPVDMGARMLVDELAPEGTPAVQVVVGSQPAYPAETFEPELRSYQIRRRLKLEANPFLLDHRIGGRAVLPATCAATWVANACEQLHPGYTFFSVEDYKVLKGIVFDDSLAEEHILDLRETAKTPDGRINFEARVWSKGPKDRPLYHYGLNVQLVRNLPQPVPVTGPAQLSADGDIPGSRLYEDGTLFHGPAFRGVERVRQVEQDRLVMDCLLPRVDAAVQGQFPVQSGNPYIYDAVVQCLLIWSQKHYDAPCLPSSLERMVQYRPIPFDQRVQVSMKVRSHTESSVTGDISVHDPDGSLYVQILGLVGTISPSLKRLLANTETSMLTSAA